MSEQPIENQPKTPREHARIFFSGMAMGAADIVPGVSGGTMAFILDIYEDLINAIKSVNIDAIRSLLKLDIKSVFDIVHWQFLIVLLAGIGTSIIALSSILTYLLEEETVLLFSFFFGLVIASIIAIGARIEEWRKPVVSGSLLAGTIIAFLIVGLVPADAPNDPLTLFFSGSIAIMAMVLPGISGSFILLILGQYEYVLESVTEFRVLDLMFVAAGCAIGIMLFSRLLSYMLTNYRQTVIAALVGFMIGSLRKIYPWKETLETGIDRHGDEFAIRERLIAPDFASTEFLYAVILILAGFLLVSFLEHQQSKSNPVFLRAGRLLGRESNTTAPPVAENTQE